MEKKLITFARIVSLIFTPFYIPLVALILLFCLTYLKDYEGRFKVNVLIVVYLFTILLPTLLIYYYRKIITQKKIKKHSREIRMIPYIISITCYFSCFYLLIFLRVPFCISSLLIAALMIQLACAFINIWWKISTHTAGIGALTGGFIVFSIKFGYFSLFWLCVAIFIAGVVGTSRMILRQHNLSQVCGGYLLGLLIASYYLKSLTLF